MVRLNVIYTRTGDMGESGLGDGTRRPKTDARFAAMGDVDETNCAVGLARLHTQNAEELCDCRERLEFVSHYFQGEVIERVIQDLNGLEEFFRDAFGNGYYCSPGIVLDGSICNICNQDFRACSHIAGRLYAGRICFYQPLNPQIDHVAIVKTPKDLRCRIWDWHIKDNEDKKTGITIENLCVLTTFSVNDFLRAFES